MQVYRSANCFRSQLQLLNGLIRRQTSLNQRHSVMPLSRCFKAIIQKPPSGVSSFRSKPRQGLMTRTLKDIAHQEQDSLLFNADYAELTRAFLSTPDGAEHRIFLIQPLIKTPDPQRRSNAQSQMDEAVALATTIRNWKITGKTTATTINVARKMVFGSGTLDTLKRAVNGHEVQPSAIFVNIGKLTGSQHIELSAFFGVAILDRYSVILQIFRQHARSNVSKLQVALAEIPYFRTRLQYEKGPGHGKMSSGTRYIGGSGETYLELQRRLLDEREVKLKQALRKIGDQREVYRKQRRKKELPIVAVVGYTNSGKTSLIKALTGDGDLQPADQLFATLDVTLHGGVLPSRMPVAYVDTVGFISDIPTELVASFASTLEDAMQADAIIHVRDLSHGSTEQQRTCVLETLRRIHLPMHVYNNIIEVGNKIDLLPTGYEVQQQSVDNMFIPVSATSGQGLGKLLSKVEELLLQVTNRQTAVFRATSGGEEYRWLHKEGAVGRVTSDPVDSQFLFMEVILSTSAMEKFRYKYGDLQVGTDNVKDN